MMATRLWLLQRKYTKGEPVYDCNYGFVIRADDASDARLMASKEMGDEGADCWLSDDKSSCEELSQDGETAIILVDFNAG